MRRMLILLFALGVIAVDALAQSTRSPTSQDEAQIRKIEAEAGQFEQANDLSIMKLLADDWVGSADGKVISRADLESGVKRNLSAHGNGPNPYTVQKKNLVVFLFHDTAVVTYTKEYRQMADPTKVHDEDITDVFVRSPEGWLWQFSKVAPVAAKSATD
jgi:hypothetical protein